jgi:hypothetical protein
LKVSDSSDIITTDLLIQVLSCLILNSLNDEIRFA